jgi:hypothetical protein
MQRISISLDEADYETLKARADRESRSISSTAALLVRAGLGPEPDTPESVDRKMAQAMGHVRRTVGGGTSSKPVTDLAPPPKGPAHQPPPITDHPFKAGKSAMRCGTCRKTMGQHA